LHVNVLREFPSLRNTLKSIEEDSTPDDFQEFSQVEMKLGSICIGWARGVVGTIWNWGLVGGCM